MSWIHLPFSLDLSTFGIVSIWSQYFCNLRAQMIYVMEGFIKRFLQTPPGLHTFQNKTLQLISKIYCSLFPWRKTFEHVLLRGKERRQQNSQLTRRSNSRRRSRGPAARFTSAKPRHLTNRKWRKKGKKEVCSSHKTSISIKVAVRLIESGETRWEEGVWSNTGRTFNPSVSLLMMASKTGRWF